MINRITLIVTTLIILLAETSISADSPLDIFRANVSDADTVTIIGTIQPAELAEIEKINIQISDKSQINQLIALLCDCKLSYHDLRLSLDDSSKLVPGIKITFKKNNSPSKAIAYSRWNMIIFEDNSGAVVETHGHYGRFVSYLKKLQQKNKLQ